jgi:hypothetical protein
MKNMFAIILTNSICLMSGSILEISKTALLFEKFKTVMLFTEMIVGTRSAAKFITAPGQCELSALWQDSETAMACKCRFDKLATVGAKPVIVELKTTKDAGPNSFGKDLYSYGYAAQAAYYVDAHKIITGTDAMHVFVAVENSAPWAVAVYMLTDAAIQEQSRQFDLNREDAQQTRNDFAPYREAGTSALGTLQGEIDMPVSAADVM